MNSDASSSSLRRQALILAREAARRKGRNRLSTYRPYAKQREFHDAGVAHRERLFMAGNQLGKTLAGSFELAMHLTGRYPSWWRGRRFDAPGRYWASGETRISTRDTVQKLLLGDPERPEAWGKGAVPGEAILATHRAAGMANAIDAVTVAHVAGGASTLLFKAYEQGRAKWQDLAADHVHGSRRQCRQYLGRPRPRRLRRDGRAERHLMAITRIGAVSAAASSVSLPVHQPGDLIVIFAARDNSQSGLGMPVGYTSISSVGANSVSLRAGYKIATSSGEISGRWANATSIHAHVLRGTDTATVIGGTSVGTAANATVSYNGLVMRDVTGSSWVLACAFDLNISNGIDISPKGMTKSTDQIVSTTSESATFDTDGGVSSWSTQTTSIASSARWRTLVVEILAASTGTIVSIATAKLAGTGQALSVNAKSNAALTAGAVSHAGQPIVVNAKKLIATVAGMIICAGQAISLKGGKGGRIVAIIGRGLRMLMGTGL